MEPGYVLDYVYAYDEDGRVGQLLLYALPEDGERLPGAMSIQEVEAVTKAAANAFEHIKTDGTPDSFFELVVLRIMGNQFYLFAHAQYAILRRLLEWNR